jgi:AcrR family transcriptional regulator
MKRNTKEDILSACIDLFSENGFSAVSVRDIARRVGINESSMYNHFTSKDEILETVVQKFSAGFGRAYSMDEVALENQLKVAGPEVFLQNHVLNVRERMAPEVQKTWKIIYMESFRSPRIREFYLTVAWQAPVDFYERVFTRMLQKGMIQAQDPKALAGEFNFAMVGLLIEFLMLQQAGGTDTGENLKKMFAHIHFFCGAIKR